MNYLEKELRERIKREDTIFDFLQESTLDGLWYWDLTNPEEEWLNPVFWKILGYDPAKMPHKSSSWMEIIDPQDLEIAKQKVAEHIEDPNKPYDQIIRYTHAAGHTVWIRCRGMILRDKDGTPIRMLGAHTDVTELKQKEEILERCNTAAKIGYWEINFSDQEVKLSNMARTILGLTSHFEPAVENLFGDAEKPEALEELVKVIEQAKDSKTEQQVETLIKTETGEEKWVELLVIPEYYCQTCSKIFGTVQDVDERIRNSQKIGKLLREAEKQNDRLMNFAHTISHNLRSQVGGVTSLIELMELENSDITEDELFKYLKSSSKKLSDTVVHLSDIAIGDEFGEDDYESIDLQVTIQNNIRAIMSSERHNTDTIKIINEVSDDFKIDAIKGYLDSVIYNLISNAVKYRDPKKESNVTIKAGRDRENTWITIEDNGLGIDLDKFGNKVFNLHSTFHDNENSSGVGLFVTKNQVLAMGGKIDVESEPLDGTIFKVSLPVRLSRTRLEQS